MINTIRSEGRPAATYLRAVAAMIVSLSLSAVASAQDADAAARGKAVFVLSCEACHGTAVGAGGRKQLPGTNALQIKYQGRVPAALEQRSDLSTPVLKQYLRNGSWSMPPFRKSELSDADIADIAAYLAQSSKAPTR
jgi:(+)-pinoresinol hydroxylase